MINLTDWIAVIPSEDKCIAYVGENETVTREFFLPDIAYKTYNFYLDLAFDLSTVSGQSVPRAIESAQQSTTEQVNADGTTVTATTSTKKESYTQTDLIVDCEDTTDIAPLSKLVRQDGIYLTWTVLAQHTQLPGLLRATLRAVSTDGQIKKSGMMVFYVSPSVAATPAAPIQLTEYEQMERAMVQALQKETDEMLAKFSDRLGDAEDLKEYIDDKTAPAEIGGDYGTVKLGFGVTTGLGVRGDGCLTISKATEEEIDSRADDTLGEFKSHAITLGTLDHAVKAVGDGHYALQSDLPKPADIGPENYGTVKLDFGGNTSLGITGKGYLTVIHATEEEIDSRANDFVGEFKNRVLTIGTLDHAVKAVGDGYYALQSDIGDIEAALDGIIAMQNALIGGDA